MNTPRYRWDTPYDWLTDKAREWERSALYNALESLARKTDSDTLQDIFQDEMTDDGYFRQEEE